MDYPNNYNIAQVCNRHNQPILCYEKINQMPNCLACLLEKNDMISAETYQQKLTEFINKEKLNHINNKQLYQNIYNSILNYKNSLVQSLDKMLQNIKDQMVMIDSNQQQVQKYTEQNKQERSIEDLEKQIQQQQLSNEQFKNQIKLQLDELQKKYLTSEQLITSFDQKQKIVISEQVLDWNKIECQIVKESSRKERKICRAFAFNKENTILFVTCEKEIIVYQFINGVIAQELQRLTDHTNSFYCLYFMQQSNWFVSGNGSDIIIWEFDDSKNKWFAKQKLQKHTDTVYCIVMNANEDLLISGGWDQTIKFWKKNKNNWSCQQTINMENYVQAISINEMENKLISCGYKQFISIMEKENDDQWIIVQTINVSFNGCRLCFTDGDQFVFQPEYGDQLEVYSYDKGKKQFQITQNVQINEQGEAYQFFPCQYIKQLKMISLKHCTHLNLFKINQTGDYQLIQSIEFQSNFLFGRLTDDGQHLITWDNGSKEIQFRKLKFLK